MLRIRIASAVLAIVAAFHAAPAVRAAVPTIEQLTADAGKGEAEAIYRLAQAHVLGAGVPKDARRAYELMQQAAEKGHPDAVGGMGYFYGTGIMVKKDFAAAAEWFRKGAELGGPRSQVNYGRAFLTGRGVPKDEKKGVEWIDKAVAQGLPYAWFMKGDFYFRGEYGHPQDYAKAREYLEKAAAADNAAAQNMLGTIHEQGLGVPVDFEKAIHWFRKAAEQGDPKGMANLGLNLGPDGPDASKHVEALTWLMLASRANEPMSRKVIGEVMRTRPPEVVKEAQARMAKFKPRLSEEYGRKVE